MVTSCATQSGQLFIVILRGVDSYHYNFEFNVL